MECYSSLVFVSRMSCCCCCCCLFFFLFAFLLIYLDLALSFQAHFWIVFFSVICTRQFLLLLLFTVPFVQRAQCVWCYLLVMRQIFISLSLMVYIDHKLHDSVYSCCAELENYRQTFYFFFSFSLLCSIFSFFATHFESMCVFECVLSALCPTLFSVSHLKLLPLIDS